MTTTKPLTADEAEKLARECLKEDNGFNYPDWVITAEKLSHMFLSGDMRREIENAAYRRCLEIADMAMLDGKSAAARSNRITIRQIKSDIRALIQPPEQRENGK